MTAAEGTARFQAVEDVRAFVQEVGNDYDPLPEGALPRADTLAALQALEAACNALHLLAWDDEDVGLCWCPDGWFDRELDTGAPRHDEHSGACRKAGAALAAVRSGRAGA